MYQFANTVGAYSIHVKYILNKKDTQQLYSTELLATYDIIKSLHFPLLYGSVELWIFSISFVAPFQNS